MTKLTDKLEGYQELHGMGENIRGFVSQDNKEMVFVADLSKEGRESQSGKSKILASTGGNVRIPTADCQVGLNIYRKV